MPFPTLDEVVLQLREIAEDDTIGPDSRLTSLDIDSLDVMTSAILAGLASDLRRTRDALDEASARV